MHYFCTKFMQMTKLYQDLKIKCAEKGTNLTKLCKIVGVSRSTPDRWKDREPTTRRIADKMFAALDELHN